MKTLLQKAFGNIETVRRWIRYIREVRSLRERIEEMDWEASQYRAKILRLDADVMARDAQIKDLLVVNRELPEDIQRLLNDAETLLTCAQYSRMSGSDVRQWLSDMRSWRHESRRERGGCR